jgi:hypothetical protein
MGVVTRLETLTPRKAAEDFEHKSPNRPVSESYARFLADAIEEGRFVVNGETLKFLEDGALIDGQHRCLAVIMANKAIKTFVTRGLTAENFNGFDVFDTIDIGRRRTVGDVFSKHGENNARSVAAAVGWLWRHERGIMAGGRGQTPRHDQAVETLKNHPGIRESVTKTHGLKRLGPQSIFAAFHYLFSEKDPQAADDFCSALVTGENLSKSSPATSGLYLLRGRLHDNQTGKAKLTYQEISALTIKVWNAIRNKTVLKQLGWRRTGDRPEDFPEIE